MSFSTIALYGWLVIQTPTRRDVYKVNYGSLITRHGRYLFPNQSQLVVRIDQEGIVCCVYRDAEGRERVNTLPEFRPGTSQRWGVVVDSAEWLWFNSSDIGDAVWIRDDQGKYTKLNSAGTDVDPAIKAKRPPNLKWRD